MDKPLPSDPALLSHIVDVHCHPTESPYSQQDAQQCPIRLCAMASHLQDQDLVKKLATDHPDKIIPFFGYHPWYCHPISIEPPTSKEDHYRSLFLSNNSSPKHQEAFDKLLPSLPDPVHLQDVLSTLEGNLNQFPSAMLGEVGLDRSMRVPFPSTSDGGSRSLSPFKVPIEHQIHILEAQIRLAVKLKRHISFHSVNAQQITGSLFDRMSQELKGDWLRISIDMHSCGLSAETWGALEKAHPNVFLSLSTAINGRTSSHRTLIQACSNERILAESDYSQLSECAPRTWDMIKIIADVKQWRVEEEWEKDVNPADANAGVVRRLASNWEIFLQGGHVRDARKNSKRSKRELLYDSEDE